MVKLNLTNAITAELTMVEIIRKDYGTATTCNATKILDKSSLTARDVLRYLVDVSKTCSFNVKEMEIICNTTD